MNHAGPPVAPPLRHRRNLRAGAGLLAVAFLVGALVLGEALGWPFLAQPLQGLLADRLGRRVSLAAADSPTAGTAFSLRFVGGLRLQAARVEVAAPAWSAAPHTLLADDLSLALRYADLWRAYRGQPLRIDRLQARMLDAELERLADGRASWHFAGKDSAVAAAPPLVWPSFGQLELATGSLRYRDVPLKLALDAQLRLDEAAGDGGARRLQLLATGSYRGQPLKAELVSASATASSAPGGRSAATPLTLKATVGRASLQFTGQAADAGDLNDISGRFSLSGPSLAAVGDPLGVTLPTTAAFRAAGVLVKQGATWLVRVDDASVGGSRLNGAFRFDAGRAVPLLSGRLGGRRLLLQDLGPVVGTTPLASAAADAPRPSTPADTTMPVHAATTAAPVRASRQATRTPAKRPTLDKVLPARPFDLAALRDMDANVLVEIDELELGTWLLEPLRPLRGHLQLRAGVLSLDDLDARTGEGRLSGRVGLDGRAEPALWSTQLRWDEIRLERWIRQVRAADAPPYVTGRWSGQAQLQGKGVSTAQILGSLKGQMRSQLRGGSVSHLVVEAAGVDVAESLGLLIRGDVTLPVTCAAADVAVQDGVLRSRVFVLDTADSTAWLDGSVSLASEDIDLRMVVSPKDFSPLTLRAPLHVGGSLAQPTLSVESGPLAAKVAAAVLLGLVTPLAALIPLLDPGNAEDAQRGAADCLALSQRGKLRLAQVPPSVPR